MSWFAKSGGAHGSLPESELATVIDNLHEGVVVYDEQFSFSVFNRAADRILGVAAAEVVGQTFSLSGAHATDARFKVLLTVLFPALAANIVRRSEPGVYPQLYDLSFDDPPLELRITTTRITGADGAPRGYLKLIQDRTRELELMHTKREFITIASHQLRTPLSGLNWALDALRKEITDPSQKELLEASATAVNRTLTIVNDLLDVAKIEEGKFGYQFQEFDLVAFLEEALVQAQPVAAQYQVKVYFEKPASPARLAEAPAERAGGPREGAITVTADPAKLGAAVANLLDNAVKYNVANGEVVVRVARESASPYVQVSVRDTGIGIPEDVLPKLFTKFFRTESAVKVAVEGTGLGLYITKNIIRRHGGKIWAQSTVGRGTTIFFTLPTDPALIPAHEYADEE